MIKPLFNCFLLLTLVAPLLAQTEVSGDQWGVWDRAGSPYLVTGDIRVPPDCTLTIGPGVMVDFQGYYTLLVDSAAALTAVGAPGDSILFTTDTLANPGRWSGIKLVNADSSLFSYCIVEHGLVQTDFVNSTGAGIYAHRSRLRVHRSTFRYNHAKYLSGGIYVFESDSVAVDSGVFVVRVDSCRFYGNYGGAGAAIYFHFSTGEVSDCNFTNNREVAQGTLSVVSGTLTVTDCLFEGNRAIGLGLSGGALYCSTSYCYIVNCTFRDNSAISGGAIISDVARLVVEDCLFEANQATGQGGAIYNRGGPPGLIRRNLFLNNRIVWDTGEGSAISVWGSARLDSNLFIGNQAVDVGAVSLLADDVSLRYNLFYANTGGFSALDFDHGPRRVSILEHNTFYNNPAPPGGSVIMHLNWAFPPDTVDSRNNIIWDDTFDRPTMILLRKRARVRLSYNDIDRGQSNIIVVDEAEVLWGPGNIDADPYFVDPAGEDFRLQPGSPVIDAGDPDAPLDPDGTRADMGAYFFDQLAAVEEQSGGLPTSFRLLPAWPNPFNSRTWIIYETTEQAHLELAVYDLLGRRVATLASREHAPGRYGVGWSGRDAAGRELPTGVYIARLITANQNLSIKMMLLK